MVCSCLCNLISSSILSLAYWVYATFIPHDVKIEWLFQSVNQNSANNMRS